MSKLYYDRRISFLVYQKAKAENFKKLMQISANEREAALTELFLSCNNSTVTKIDVKSPKILFSNLVENSWESERDKAKKLLTEIKLNNSIINAEHESILDRYWLDFKCNLLPSSASLPAWLSVCADSPTAHWTSDLKTPPFRAGVALTAPTSSTRSQPMSPLLPLAEKPARPSGG